MAIRTIEYTVTADGISPIAVQQGGVQGEHNATEVHFLIDSKFFDTIEEQAGQNAVYYHFEAYNGIGNRISTELKELERNMLIYPIENSLTRYGGNVRVILAITVTEESTAKMITYSYPAILKLKNKPSGNEEGDREVKEVSALVLAARLSADTAIKAAEDAEKHCDDSKAHRDEAESFAETAGEYAWETKVSAGEAEEFAKVACSHKTSAESASNNAQASATQASGYAEDAEGYRDEAEKFAQNIQASVKEATEILNSTKNNFCNALKGTASGTLVRLDDVSPIEHTLDVEVSVPIQTATGIAAPVKLPNVKWCRVLPIGCSYEELIFKMTSGRSFSVRLDEDDTYFEPDEQGITATIVGGTLTIEGYLDDGSKVKVFQQHTIENGDAIAEVLESDGYNDLQVEYKNAATLVRTGKNLFNINTMKGGYDTNNGSSYTNNGDGTLTINGYVCFTGVTLQECCPALKIGDKVRLSLTKDINSLKYFRLKQAAKTIATNEAVTIDVNMLNSEVGIYGNNDGLPHSYSDVQIEYGTVPTDFEPYVNSVNYSLEGDGTVYGVTNLYPTTCLSGRYTSGNIVDDISVTYNRDINKAFAELITAVQTLGGTI